MSQLWYYVQDGERIGPVSHEEVISLIKRETLDNQSYVWRKGFSDWMHISDVEELEVKEEKIEEIHDEEPMKASDLEIEVESEVEAFDSMPSENINLDHESSVLSFTQPDNHDEDKLVTNVLEDIQAYSLSQFGLDKALFFIRTGADRGEAKSEYGPFKFNQLKKLLFEKRINEKTQIFTSKMNHWLSLGAFSDFESLFAMESHISEEEKRENIRKPFVARMFYSNRSEVFEGICRDISIGGMQVLLDNYPGETGEQISINVHPENTDYSFIADGKVVRILDGNKGFSFRFTGLSDEAKKAIERYILAEES